MASQIIICDILGKITFYPLKFGTIFNSTSNVLIFAMTPQTSNFFSIQPTLSQNSHITLNFLFLFYFFI
jgi:hypothetical protein